ncbi:beta/gamma crystallin domain-containing protein [Streptomyces sp. NBC_00582]|uniref:beta/gamma crystallin domain-containing protein n=1 Tax=Streptomyces sp. NBC_00582 TaxID=2975783 RepID=UPI002E814591|nr:beta/gamma crystallin domain-containing protein [Streptomyces sp. NBC_00582]WUB63382.1 beta/gamma crystallin domain-containing protein [Streptomyces sp. NBC_00582]
MSDQEVIFYTRTNLSGDAHPYRVGADENLYPGQLNDRFKSVKVGTKAKILAWQHANQTGKYREWDLDQADISDIGGLTRFKVVDSTTLPIAVRLEDLTGAPDGRFSLKIDSYDVGTIIVHSGDPEYGLVGVMPEDGPPVTTAIYVRNEQSGEYVATGAIHFVWNAGTKSIDVADATNFPENMEYSRDGRNRFIFKLKSV